MPYQVVTQEKIGALKEKEVSDIMSKNRLANFEKYTSYMTKHILGITDEEEFIDDVEYNQRWWKWYCEENKLDVNTGKSFESIFMNVRPIF